MLRVQEEESEIPQLDGGGVPVYNYKGKPFTGVVFKKRQDGSLAWEQEYQNGFQEGWCRSYHKNGKKAQEYQAHNNLEIDNTFKKWDEDGKLLASF